MNIALQLLRVITITIFITCTGITNEADEARDAPNYVPRVFSSATHYGSIYTDSRFIPSSSPASSVVGSINTGFQYGSSVYNIYYIYPATDPFIQIPGSSLSQFPSLILSSGQSALKRRSRTPLSASSLPGKRHQVKIVNGLRIRLIIKK